MTSCTIETVVKDECAELFDFPRYWADIDHMLTWIVPVHTTNGYEPPDNTMKIGDIMYWWKNIREQEQSDYWSNK